MNDINQIKLALVKAKRTNKRLAEQLNANPTTVSKWYTNKLQPNLYILKKNSQLLNTSVTDLVVSE